MSERPTTTTPDVSRLRRPWSRFRDLPIWSKLGVIMIVPTLATIVVGTNGLIGYIDTASNANRARVLAVVSEESGELVHHLQNERAAAVMLLGSQGEEQVEARNTAYSEAQRAVDEAEVQFQNQSATLTDVPASFRELLGDVRSQLSVLPQTRNGVASSGLGVIDTTTTYQELIVGLLNLRDLSVQLAGEEELSDRMRAAASVSQAKEFLSQRRVVGHEVLIRNAYHPPLRREFLGAETGLEQSLQDFAVVATAEEQATLDQALEGSDVRQSRLYQGQLDSLEGGSLNNLPWNAEEWDAALATHADLMRDVEAQLDQVVVADATALRDAVTQRLLVETGALLGMLLLAILLAWLVARSMARSLRDLRQGALSVAQYGLPQAVARLRDPALSTQLSPAEVANQIAEPLPVRSKDEFGQVAVAFNAVHLEAVRTAAEQAQLRSSVATMFVNLARRSQILVDRLISQLDRLERGEEDPDRLAELFQLDHLATRMRRNDENLLVLAGADSTRVQREPAPLMDVLRAAQSEVEHYTRIEFGVVDRDLEVSAHAVNDLVHLVAELFDNATAFSPPDSQVVVEARRVGDRAVLYVEDRGLGLSAEQLAEINDRLAKPPLVDVAVSRMMGLVVVARLAARHGVKVELRPATERGTVADVTLPASVLVPRAVGGRPAEPAQPVRGDRFGEPLALESGPSGGGRLPFSPPPFSPPPLAPSDNNAGGREPTRYRDDAGYPPVSPFPATQLPASQEPERPRPIRPAGRSMPPWSDLTGATGVTGNNGAGAGPHTAPGSSPAAAPRSPAPGSGAGSPLPRRRPGGGMAGDDAPPAGPPLIPRPRPADQPGSGTPAPAQRPPQPEQPPPAQVPQSANPPPWPPVAPETTTPVPAETGTGSGGSTAANSGVPGDQAPAAASLAWPTRPDTPTPARQPTPAGTAAQAPRSDETVELPIFREVESVWFRSRHRAPEESADQAGQPAPVSVGASASAAETTEFARVTPPPLPSRRPEQAATGAATGGTETTAGTAATGGTVRSEATPGATSRAPAGGGGVPTDEGWRTAADDGWRAASSLAEMSVQERTPAGLPKRQPMAQLVPGGVEKAPDAAQRRSPEAVRGLLSAYHRGVQRGREQMTDDEQSGSGGGSPSTQAGKERGT